MLIHWPDPNTPFEETMDAMNRMKKEGKVLHVGVSNFSIEQIKRSGSTEILKPISPSITWFTAAPRIKPFVSTCIVGAQKRERIEENARCFDHVLSPEDMQLLDVAIEKLQ